MNKTTQKNARQATYTGSIPNTPMRFVLAMTKLHYKFAIGAILMVTVAKLFGVSLAFILKQIIDTSSGSDVNTDVVFFWVLAFPVAILLMFGFWRASGFIGMQWLTRAEASAHKLLFNYVSRHSHTYFTDRFAGSISNKIAHAGEGTFRLLDNFLWGHYTSLLGIVASGILIFLTSSLIGWIYVFLILVLIPMNVVLAKYRRPLVLDYARKKTVFKGNIIDVFTNISAVRQFSRTPFETQAIYSEMDNLRASDIRQWQRSEWILVLNNIVITIAVGLIMLVMFYKWKQGSVTIGDFVLVSTLMVDLQGTLTFIGNSINQFIKEYGQVEEGLDEVLRDHEIVDVNNARNLNTNGGRIDWKRVTFEFGNNTVFDEFILSIEPGQRVGLVGPSGAGKTTFVSLLLRQHEITSGAIEIDGQNISEVTQDSLRANIAVVPQEPLLFHRTIKENIAYGNPDATQEEIEEVAKKAQAHEFIMKLEEGYDTMVGERGIKLSGGQKQRVAIARAMLKDAPILVLDEATSALDSESEVEIQKALHILMEGKTVIAVAHRLSTLREMDRILVLETGKIMEDGSHDELAKSGGTYQKLWEHQAGGFLNS